jgi:chemosensory pili system protein ChpA (sensor histidine kinase/response regulator)
MGGVIYPLVYLRDALHLGGSVDDSQLSVPVLFVNVGDKQVAFAVDCIIASREIVVKTLGTHFRHVHGLIGATLLGDGTVVPILNCSEVLEAPVTRTVGHDDESDDVAHDARITVMIVDDSVSVRRITAKILNAAGMETILCRDGVDALETLQRLPTAPDLVLLDVEMPRMDGYELLSTLRSQSDYETLPVVMVTSRSGDKQRNKAQQLGATDYLVKPYDEDELVTTIQHHVANARESVGA